MVCLGGLKGKPGVPLPLHPSPPHLHLLPLSHHYPPPPLIRPWPQGHALCRWSLWDKHNDGNASHLNPSLTSMWYLMFKLHIGYIEFGYISLCLCDCGPDFRRPPIVESWGLDMCCTPSVSRVLWWVWFRTGIVTAMPLVSHIHLNKERRQRKNDQLLSHQYKESSSTPYRWCHLGCTLGPYI